MSVRDIFVLNAFFFLLDEGNITVFITHSDDARGTN